jgi:NADPH:quinone reductase-like Zn-dependent oxidoreductase
MTRLLTSRVLSSTERLCDVCSTPFTRFVNATIEKLEIRPVIDQVFTFAEANTALKRLESAGHFGKIVIRVD